ncbi:hypothetical protein HMPREF1981_00021 [Bacteroides pyogenes F0041]|uniref:Glycosyltransferase, group 1 family protein n=1 Tax=Bacteroides pyogenes F0041 TaxID=1321819 RepID=U2CXN3_9BACE|nr:hypothetical protein [Bacteroides pyogenes]ERI89310.1 hypothetical protein HMPREF1981_00021 [Bacteroides pyogenes F0041]
MTKILITDFLFVDAHRAVNLNLIRQIANASDKVSVLSVNNYYSGNKDEFVHQGISVIEKQRPGTRFGKFKGKLHIMNIMKLTSEIAKKEHFDVVVSLAYDSVAAILGKFLFHNLKVCLFNHKNIDELTNPVVRALFNLYKNNYIHIVFEKRFGDYLKSKYKVKDVYEIPHPLIVNSTVVIKDSTEYDCVALCNSNDENMLDSLVDAYDSNNEKITILARSKKRRENKGGLSFFKGFIEYEKYYSLLSSSRFVFVPLPESYKYRLSASVYDALALRKPVITTNKFYADGLNSQFPGVCKYVSGAKDLLDLINADDICVEKNNSFDSFVEQHSAEYIKFSFEKLFDNIKKN